MGGGKTYFIRNQVMERLKKENNYPVYFSIYGYNDLNNLKQELFYQLFSVLSSNRNMMSSINRVNKKFKKISNILGDSKLKSVGLISDWILESYNKSKLDSSITERSIIIFIDDLERVSKEIALKDLLGFILNELLEKIHCKVIILSNNLEISEEEEFKKIKEKVVSRTVKFTYDMLTIEDIILKKSKNIFIRKNSSWIRIILENQQIISRKKGLNIRTLFSIIENFDFVESQLIESINSLETKELKIRRSIFLNVFVITNEYKLGNIDENSFELLKKLTNTRFFSYYLTEDDVKTISEKIIDQYHELCREFDDYIFYSNDIISYILLGYIDEINYIKNWKNSFLPKPKEISNLDKLRDFRRFSDDELKLIQKNILMDVENDKFEFEELVRVYGQLNQFEKMGLMLLDNDYSEIIESKLTDIYISVATGESVNLVDSFFMSGFENIKKEKPKLLEAFKRIDNQIDTDKIKKFLDSLFNENYEELRTMKQNGFLLNNNIFKAMLVDESIDQYIVTDDNKADLLWHFINSEYLRISNSRDFHSGEIEDVKSFLKEIRDKMDETNLGRIDGFKVRQLIESLEKLIEHLK